MRVDIHIPNVPKASPKVAEILAKIQASSTDLEATTVESTGSGRNTKNFYKAHIAGFKNHVENIYRQQRENPSMTDLSKGMGLLFKTFEDQLRNAREQMALAPDLPGLVDFKV